MATVATLNVALKAQTRDLLRGLDRGARGIKTFVLKLEALKFGLRTLSSVSRRAADSFFGSFSDIEALDVLRKNTGFAVQDLQALQLEAGRNQIEFSRLKGGLVAFTKRLGEAQHGTGEAVKALKQLKLKPKDLVAAGTSEAFRQVLDEIEKLPTVFDKSAVSFKLFSDVGRELIPIIEGGREKIDGLVNEVDKLGISISDLEAGAISRVNAQFEQLRFQLQGLGRRFAVELAPAISLAISKMREMMASGSDLRKSIKATAEVIIRSAVGVANAFASISRALVQANVMLLKFLRSQVRLLNVEFAGALTQEIERLQELLRDIKPVSADKIISDLNAAMKGFDAAREGARGGPGLGVSAGIQPIQAVQRGTVEAVSKIASILNRPFSERVAQAQLDELGGINDRLDVLIDRAPQIELAEGLV